jgi:hypothetical protein
VPRDPSTQTTVPVNCTFSTIIRPSAFREYVLVKGSHFRLVKLLAMSARNSYPFLIEANLTPYAGIQGPKRSQSDSPDI